MKVYKFESYKNLIVILGKKKSPDFLGIYSYFNSFNQNNLFILFVSLLKFNKGKTTCSK